MGTSSTIIRREIRYLDDIQTPPMVTHAHGPSLPPDRLESGRKPLISSRSSPTGATTEQEQRCCSLEKTLPVKTNKKKKVWLVKITSFSHFFFFPVSGNSCRGSRLPRGVGEDFRFYNQKNSRQKPRNVASFSLNRSPSSNLLNLFHSFFFFFFFPKLDAAGFKQTPFFQPPKF